jgi:hypothetical protein
MDTRDQSPKKARKTMISNQLSEANPQRKDQDQDRLKAVIRSCVLDALGGKNCLGRVEVRALWSDYYRVNIFMGDSPGSITIASSFFIEADENGNIVQSQPPLKRREERP